MDVKEKLVELLDRFVYDEWYGNGDIAEKLMSNGVTVQEWISVDDRLPDETGRYLAVKKRIAPDELGGNKYMVNGNMVDLKNVGAAYTGNQNKVEEKPPEETSTNRRKKT